MEIPGSFFGTWRSQDSSLEHGDPCFKHVDPSIPVRNMEIPIRNMEIPGSLLEHWGHRILVSNMDTLGSLFGTLRSQDRCFRKRSPQMRSIKSVLYGYFYPIKGHILLCQYNKAFKLMDYYPYTKYQGRSFFEIVQIFWSLKKVTLNFSHNLVSVTCFQPPLVSISMDMEHYSLIRVSSTLVQAAIFTSTCWLMLPTGCCFCFMVNKTLCLWRWEMASCCFSMT